MLDVLCSLFCFTPCLGRGALPLSQDCGGPMKPPGHGLFITKHLLMACGHRPVGSSPRPGEQCVPGVCLGFSLTHQVTVGKSLGFLAPLSPAVKFFWSALPTNPPRRLSSATIPCLWNPRSDGGNQWEQMLHLGPCPDELVFPKCLGNHK